jgi:hypothetical protein
MRWETDYCQSQVDAAINPHITSPDALKAMRETYAKLTTAKPIDYSQAINSAAMAIPCRGTATMAQPLEHQQPYLAVPRPVRTEVELLREKLAAAEALIETLTPPPAAPVPNPMQRALSRWPGSVGVIQGLRWRA